jgi:hypothetical protein
MTTLRQKDSRTLLAALALALMAGLPAASQDVVLNPQTISGTVNIGGSPLNQVSISADSPPYSASTTVSPDATTSASYYLTVQVEPGQTRNYTVYASIYSDSYRDYLYIRDRTVAVTDGTPAVLDFVFNPSGVVSGDVTVTGGGTLQSLYVYAYKTTAPYDYGRTSFSTSGGPSSASFYFPVTPGDYRCYGAATLTGGTEISLPNKYVTVAAGQNVDCSYEIATPAASSYGSIIGTVELSGPVSVTRYDVNSSGPTYRYAYQYPPFDGPGNADGYSLPDLNPGSYTLTARAYLNNYDDRLDFPSPAYDPARYGNSVAAGASTTVNASACQSFVNGALTLTGPASLDDLSSGQIEAQGRNTSQTDPAYGGYATDRITAGSGAFDLILTNGEWIPNRSYSLNLYRPPSDPDGYFNQNIYSFYDYSATPLTLTCGETATRNLEFATGSFTVNFQVTGGATLSSPQLSGGPCYQYDDQGVLLYRYYLNSDSNQQYVTEGSVTLQAPAAHCTNVQARATVNGSSTTFGTLDFDIEPGVDVVVDIGAPSVTVTAPPTETCVDADEVTVTGVATDDIGVESLTVNGIATTLTSTGNASDPNEVSFSVTVPLPVKGPNTLVIVATDAAGNVNQRTIQVCNDAAPPSVSFTPADGTVTTLTSLELDGTATDDAGIKSVAISVDGSHVANLNGSGSLSFPFGQTLSLAVGDRSITVVATDISNRSTTVVHQVSVITNGPPTLTAASSTVGEYEGTSIANTGTVSDLDGDTVSLSASIGSVVNNGNGTWSWSATPDDGPGESQTVTITGDDGQGGTGQTTFQMNVVNAAPTGTFNSPASVMAGESFVISINGVSDTSSADTTAGFSYAFDCGAGFSAPGASNAASCTATAGTTSQGVQGKVIDKDGGETSYSATVTVTNPPSVSADSPSVSVNEASTASNTGTYSDIDPGDVVTLSADVGVVAPSGSNTWSWSLTPDDGPSQSGTVTITVTDSLGQTATASFPLTVANVAPLGVLSAPAAVNEGDSFSLAIGSVSDPSMADTSSGFDYAFDCGAGLGATVAASAVSCATAIDDETLAAGGRVYDKDQGFSSFAANIAVVNVAPTIGNIVGPSLLAIGSQADLVVGYSDPGAEDTHTCEFSWDDDPTSPTISTVTDIPAGTGQCTDSFTFGAAGVYSVTVTVTDDDGGSDQQAYEFIVVYDPSAGFVTGGGWINSPAGAYPDDPDLTGKANFGFVAKYKKGQSTPDGQTEFQFKAGNLNFHSSSYQWLVVAGTKAQFKGDGTINGAGDYGFLLTAQDGDIDPSGPGPDTFRIKIWDKSNGDAVVYDNQYGSSDDIDASDLTALGGGSIVIHNQSGGGKK